MRTPNRFPLALTVVVCLTALSSVTPVRAAPDWIAMIDYRHENGWSLTTRDGFVYCAGVSMFPSDSGPRQVVVAKYRVDGSLVWVRFRPVPAVASVLGRDTARVALAKDALYVITQDGARVHLLKYDLDGNLEWINDDFGTTYSMSLVIRDEMIFVGGTRVGGDLAVARFDGLGALLWESHHPTSDLSLHSALAVDASGNACVTGTEQPVNGPAYRDFLTASFASDGSLNWAHRYDGPAGLDDASSDIATDDAGNVYVAGVSVAVEGGREIPVDLGSPAPGTDELATIKYSPSGEVLWIKRFVAGPESDAVRFPRVAVQASQVYVSGSMKVTPQDQPALFAFVYQVGGSGGYGKETWVRSWALSATDVMLSGMSVDQGGVVSLAVNLFDLGTSEFGIGARSFKADGSVWNAPSYYWPGAGFFVRAYDVAVDIQRNMYVTGCESGTQPGVGADMLTARFGSQIGLAATSSDDSETITRTSKMQVRGFLRGDADGNGVVEVNDGLAILEYLEGRSEARLACLDAADADDNGRIDDRDAALILDSVFRRNPSPPDDPSPYCAPDPGPGLGCDRYDACSDPEAGGERDDEASRIGAAGDSVDSTGHAPERAI